MPNCHHHWRRLLPFEIRTPFAAAWRKNKSTHSWGVRNAARRSKWGQTTTSQQSWGLCLKIGFASYVYLFWARVKEKSHTQRKKKYISQLFSQINIEIPSFVPIFKAMQLASKFTLSSLHTMVSFITKVQKHLYIFFQKPPTFLRLCWAFCISIAAVVCVWVSVLITRPSPFMCFLPASRAWRLHPPWGCANCTPTLRLLSLLHLKALQRGRSSSLRNSLSICKSLKLPIPRKMDLDKGWLRSKLCSLFFRLPLHIFFATEKSKTPFVSSYIIDDVLPSKGTVFAKTMACCCCLLFFGFFFWKMTASLICCMHSEFLYLKVWWV